MKSFSFVPIRSRAALLWEERGFFSRSVTVTDNDKPVARLERPGWLRSRAFARTVSGEWELDRIGFFRTTAVAKVNGSEIARLNFRLYGKERLFTVNGHDYQFSQRGFWNQVWTISDHTGEELIEYRARRFSLRHRGRIDILRPIRHEADLDFLVILGLYVVWMRLQDAAVAAGS